MYGDARGGPDAPRGPSHWCAFGVGLTAVGVAAGLLLSLLHPDAHLGDGPIVLDRSSGALYVRIEQTWHPALNLASARLAAGSAATPGSVDPAALESVKRGALLGIPGAPDRIEPVAPELASTWTVCDGAQTTVVIAGQPVAAAPLDPEQPVLVSGPSGTRYLLYDGKRAAVDPRDPAVAAALQLDGAVAKPVSAALLNSVPEVAPLTVPRVTAAGNPGPEALPGTVIGDLVRVQNGSGAEYFAVVAGGVQRVGEVVADLLRYGSGTVRTEIATVAPALMRDIPRVGTLAVSTYPDRLRPPNGGEILCAGWTAGAITLSTGARLPIPMGSDALVLAQADGNGPAVDAVWLPAGRVLYVRPERAAVGGLIVSENGVRFAIEDAEAARALGLPDAPVAAPWAIVGSLPAGPGLSRQAARTVHDGLAGTAPPASR